MINFHVGYLDHDSHGLIFSKCKYYWGIGSIVSRFLSDTCLSFGGWEGIRLCTDMNNMNGSLVEGKIQSSLCGCSLDKWGQSKKEDRQLGFKRKKMEKFNSSLLVLTVSLHPGHSLTAHGLDPTIVFLAAVICVNSFTSTIWRSVTCLLWNHTSVKSFSVLIPLLRNWNMAYNLTRVYDQVWKQRHWKG